MNGKQFIKICGVVTGLVAAGYAAYSQYKKQQDAVIVIENDTSEGRLEDDTRK